MSEELLTETQRRCIPNVSLGWSRKKRLVSHSSYPTLYVLFLITFTKPLPERLGLIRKFKRAVRERVKDTG